MKRETDNVGRYELKFVMPVSLRETVIDLIRPYTVADSHARDLGDGRKGYGVRSLYFDTGDLADYFDRLAEKRVRNRVRVRTYDSPHLDSPVFLENKRKSGRWVVKHRVCVGEARDWDEHRGPSPWAALVRRAQGGDRYAASAFAQLTRAGLRRPTTLVHYEREVFVPRRSDANKVRLTLDHGVRATRMVGAHDLFATAEIELLPADWIVMELKFHRFPPAWSRELLRELKLRAVPVSKYGLSVASSLRGHRQGERRYLTPRPLLEKWCAA